MQTSLSNKRYLEKIQVNIELGESAYLTMKLILETRSYLVLVMSGDMRLATQLAITTRLTLLGPKVDLVFE